MHVPQKLSLRDAAELLDDSLTLIRQSIARIDDKTTAMCGEMLMIEWACDNACRACAMIEAMDDDVAFVDAKDLR